MSTEAADNTTFQLGIAESEELAFKFMQDGKFNLVSALVKGGLDLSEAQNEDFEFFFPAACEYGPEDLINTMLDLLERKKEDIPSYDFQRQRGLQSAVYRNNVGAVRALLEWGVDPYVKHDGGGRQAFNAFDVAFIHPKRAIIELLYKPRYEEREGAEE